MNPIKKLFRLPHSQVSPTLKETVPHSSPSTSGFDGLGLSDQALQTLAQLGYDTPTPIQKQAIPFVLEGRDVLACAQTGTGKTAAFALPSIERLHKKLTQTNRVSHPRLLVLTPTRELAVQVFESFKSYGKWTRLRHVLLVGGVNDGPQIHQLRAGVDVIVATPGRMLDLINRGYADLAHIEVLVLDEADRMLDMGFLPDVKRIVKKTPDVKQTLFFSATFPREIETLANELLKNPARVSVAPPATASENVKQKVYFVDQKQKSSLLLHLLNDESMKRVIVFSRTKHGANKLCRSLEQAKITCAPIHSNKSQNARLRALDDFKNGRIRVLVASDIAARGLDVDDITHVVNFDLPEVAETYVHRIGRTGRAGAQGIALSFCNHDERSLLTQIEKLMKKNVERVTEHPFGNGSAPAAQPQPQARPQHQQQNRHRDGQSRRDSQSRPQSGNRSQNNTHPRPQQKPGGHPQPKPGDRHPQQRPATTPTEQGPSPNQHPRHKR